MDERELERLLALVQEAVPPVVHDWLPRHLGPVPGRCLPASRMGMEALRYFGVKAEPMPTRALAVNEAWIEWQQDGAEPPMPEDSWSVAVGWRTPDDHPRGISAHLVLVVEDMFLLDLDAEQLSRPQRLMPVPPTLLLPLRQAKDQAGRVYRTAGLDLDGGGRVDYVEHPERVQWKHGLDWRQAGKPAGRVIRAMKAALLSD